LTIPADGWTDFFNVRTNPILRSNFWDVTITVNRLKFRQRSEYSGCPKCYPERTQKLAGGRTQEELFQLTEKRLQWLESEGCEPDFMWECAFKRELQNRPELKQRYDAIALPSEPLNYRNPFLQLNFILTKRPNENRAH